MFSNQMILVIGGFILMTVLILSFHSTNKIHSSSSYNNEAVITASNIGTSMIEEISLKKFDHNVTSGTITPVNNLSTTLGPESGEYSVNQFNDVDDFNNYARTDTLTNLGVFNSIVKVSYVNPNNPDNNSLGKTYHKKIEVNVSNPYLSDTLKFYHIVSY
jgi:hypothetical protein